MDKDALPKAYESSQYEDAIYKAWEDAGAFNPDTLSGDRTESFSIVLPPPNVTGTLHMGHAVMLAIEDIMVRFARLTGKRALWIPGTDHAAIATQAKVEKILVSEKGIKDPRHTLGREAFLKEVDAFAKSSHDTIVSQARKMGASLDWSREAYTLDAARNHAVNTVFKMMYEDGLIYRGNRVINWCPRCQSTLADDEVQHKETTAKLYTFKYAKDFPIAISSTRPETKLGDAAVAVYPSDERYASLVGKSFDVTFAGKPLSIRIVADEGVEAEFGTGALGVTPSHSQIDEAIAKKNDLPYITVIGEDGLMTSEAGAEFAGKTVKEARAAVVAWLSEQGLLEKEEEVAQNLSVCYRCETTVEPLPKLQWFIDVNKPFAFKASTHAPIEGVKDGEEVTLKGLMQLVVRSAQIKIVPERFEKTYFHWIDNLRDWCISRQIWFGHRVPVYYKGEEIVVGDVPAGEGWVQDEDTLDTWFSSGLWTFSTLGWPEKTKDFDLYHPTAVLETGYDILPFWVARMILMSTYAIGEIPFKTVYLHGLVRDEQGRKMSKSLGNVIDPLDMIGKYGADATRLSLVIGSTPGNDSKLSEEKVGAYRNFTNKLWNISRFVLTSVESVERVANAEPVTLADRWILSRFDKVIARVTDLLESHQFSAAGEMLRDFTWGEFADWYLEIAKTQKGPSTDKILLYILERLMILWHPFMPFVTEEVWKAFGTGSFLMLETWPKATGKEDLEAEAGMQTVQEVVTVIRNLRAEYKIEASKEITVSIGAGAAESVLATQSEAIQRLTRTGLLTIAGTVEKPANAAGAVAGSVQIFVDLAGLVDKDKERTRLTTEQKEVSGYISSLDGKLANTEFVSKAPEKVVNDLKAKREEAAKKLAAIEEQLGAL